MITLKLQSLVLIGVSFASAGIIGLLFLYRKKQLKSIEEPKCKAKAVIYVPNSCVPYIFGKYGCVLQILQSKCSTCFSFTPPGLLANETKCVVKGDPENVQLAESIIYNIIRIFTHESRTGMSLEEILNKSHNDIIDNSNLTENENAILTEILLLLSSKDQAKSTQNETATDAIIPDLEYDLVQHISNYKDRTQQLVSIGGDKRIPIYVSAVAYPSQFWVQALYTKEHGELDQMTQELFDFFDYNPENNFPPVYETVKVGNLYAAFVEEQKNWYRVEVVTINSKNEKSPMHTDIDLYFLDYGYSLYMKIKDIRILPVSFLDLNFQAIECCAANIKPFGGEWSEDAIVLFEELTHSGIWYKLHAIIEKVISDQGTTNPVPCITLIDSSNDDLNINDKMVTSGFAEYST